MVSLPGRSGRRRRVLNEEVLSASSSHVALRAASDEIASNTSRYGEAAGVENHPQISDFIPRRLRTIAVLVLGGIGVTALAVAAHQFAAQFVGTLTGAAVAPIEVAIQIGLATWLSAVLLLLTCATCAIVHSIRRHRIDDVRGRYRVWRWAALVCLLASADSVAGFHTLFADAVGHVAGWSALRSGAVWWLALLSVPLAWVFTKIFLDVKESRLAALVLVLATTAYATGTASYLGFLPAPALNWEPVVTCASTLLGHWLLFASIMTYARHVVLDAQGMIAVRPAAVAKQSNRETRSSNEASLTKPATGSPKSESSRTVPALHVHNPDAREKPQIVPAKTQASMKDWVDGRRRERDRYQADDEEADDEMADGDRKLSKTERKQLRKLKARNRAA